MDAIIVDVEATTAIRQAEVLAAKRMIERSMERFDLYPAMLMGDSDQSAYSVRRDGLTVRASAIADARPAQRVGLPQPLSTPIFVPRAYQKPSTGKHFTKWRPSWPCWQHLINEFRAR